MYKRYWCVNGNRNGFNLKLFLYGTEEELQDYIITEIEGAVFESHSYYGVTDTDIKLAKILGMKIYII